MIDTWIYPLRCGHQVTLSSAIVDKKRKKFGANVCFDTREQGVQTGNNNDKVT